MTDPKKIFQKLTEKRQALSLQLKDPAAIGFWNMVMDKYSDQAHFIYELLQNADDAGATEVRIALYAERFVFIHNGIVPFSITDPDMEMERKNIGHLNAITSIGASSKQDGNTIGKFGVGFKSVFQYTERPHIEDDSFSFAIEDFIVPKEEPQLLSDRAVGETLFSIPFKNPESAYTDIEKKLVALHKPLLFLNSLKKISWKTSSGLSGYYAKEEKNSASFPLSDLTLPAGWINDKTLNYYFTTLIQKNGEEYDYEFFHLFSQEAVLNENREKTAGTVGFYASQEGNLFTGHSAEPAFCFFPTKERTELNMIVHAPFLLTDSRESIKYDEEWNKTLLKQLAQLAANGMELLCRMGFDNRKFWVNDNLFDIIPTVSTPFFKKEKGEWKPAHPFSPFFTCFQQKLSSAPVFLSSEKKYLSAPFTRYASEKNISKLFNSLQLFELTGNEDELKREWCFETQYMGNESERNEQIRKNIQYITENGLIGSYITTEFIFDRLSEDFIKKQPIEWLQQFYQFLGNKKSLWAASDSPLRHKPFILCEDGNVRAPFTPENSLVARVYLSGETEAGFPSVHPALLQNEKCLRFFESLGLQHPGMLAQIERVILPQYRENNISLSDKELIYAHLNHFVEYYTSLSFQEENRMGFLKLFEGVAFLPSFDNDGNLSLQPADNVYLDLPLTRNFLKHFSSAHFLDNSVIEEGFYPENRENLYHFLLAVGVSFGLKIKEVERPAKKAIHTYLHLNPKSLRRYDKGNQKITDKEIEGFSDFLQHVTPESSKAFLELLDKAVQTQSSYMFRLSLEGEYRYIEKSQHNYTVEKIKETTALQLLFQGKWLFDKNQTLKSPEEIRNSENLSFLYKRPHPDLFFFLGIQHDASLDKLTAAQRKAVLLIQELEEKGISMEILEDMLKNREVIDFLRKNWSK